MTEREPQPNNVPSPDREEPETEDWASNWLTERVRKTLEGTSSGDLEKDKQRLLERLPQNFEAKALRRGSEEAWDSEIERIKNTVYDNVDQMAQDLGTSIRRVLPEKFSKDDFVARLREQFNEEGKLISLNEVLSYQQSEDGREIHIHIPPYILASVFDEAEKRKRTIQFRRSFEEGMKQLADVVKENPEVKCVVGTSWIVAEHPKIMEGLGFEIDGPISKEERKQRFPGEERPIWQAHLDRGMLLKRYLNRGVDE